MKADAAFCRLRFEIWCRVANLKSHGVPLVRGAAAAPLCSTHGVSVRRMAARIREHQVIRSDDPNRPSVTAFPSSVGQEGGSFSIRSYGD